jgi:Co/Zn/Cd efflux system component
VSRLIAPVPIHFREAIPIAALGLAVNVASAWLLSGGEHPGHSHGDSHGRAHAHDDKKRIATSDGEVSLEVFEDGVPPRFRLMRGKGPPLAPSAVRVEIVRPDGARQTFAFADQGDFLDSVDVIPEPHAFDALVTIDGETRPVLFEEHEHAHGLAARDNNMRAAVIHVLADATVSVMVIVHLVLAKRLGWLWMDPVAGIVGAIVIVSWSAALIRDTGAVHESRPGHGRQPSSRDRSRRRPDRRPASLAPRAGPSRGHRFGGHAKRALRG